MDRTFPVIQNVQNGYMIYTLHGKVMLYEYICSVCQQVADGFVQFLLF